MLRTSTLQFLVFITLYQDAAASLPEIIDRDMKCKSNNDCGASTRESIDLLETSGNEKWDKDCNRKYPTDCVTDYGENQHLCWCIKGNFKDKSTELVLKAYKNYPGVIIGNNTYPYKHSKRTTAAEEDQDKQFNIDNVLVKKGFYPYSLDIKCFKGKHSNCAITYTDGDGSYMLSTFNKEDISDYMSISNDNGKTYDGGITILSWMFHFTEKVSKENLQIC